jgi:hypothetical protein
MKIVLRVVVLIVGMAAGVVAAVLLNPSELRAAVDGMPRCPRCQLRQHVGHVKYIDQPDGRQLAQVQGKYLGIWDAKTHGPSDYCMKCRHGFGSRFTQTP